MVLVTMLFPFLVLWLVSVLMGLGLWLSLAVSALCVLMLHLALLGVVMALYWYEIKGRFIQKTQSKGEHLAVSLGLIIPRKHRHVIGDILEDCAAMRRMGHCEGHIRLHVLWQWLLIVIHLVPSSVANWVMQRLNPPD